MTDMERIPIHELKDKAGYELPVLTFDIDRTLISRFAAAVGDESPQVALRGAAVDDPGAGLRHRLRTAGFLRRSGGAPRRD